MTKNIRVENADTSTHRVVVEVWNKGHDGTVDTLTETVPLDHPTSMATLMIHSERFLVIKEVPAS